MNKDAQAILILCSHLCLGEGIKPLQPSEWKKMSKLLREKKLRPSAILDMPRQDMINELNYTDEEAERLLLLLGRSASLFFEISKYEGMGISLVTRADKTYPLRLKQRLGDSCPPFFFFAGDLGLLRKHGIGFVGSRDLSTADINFESVLVEKIVKNLYAVISGGAKGADAIAEEITLTKGGRMIEFLPGSMLSKLRKSELIKSVQEGRLLLLSATNPETGFTVASAMSRNKYIYAQSDATIIIKSINKGGTWNGATESLKHSYCPVFCWNNTEYTDNLELIANGALPIHEDWNIQEIKTVNSSTKSPSSQQLDLFA